MVEEEEDVTELFAKLHLSDDCKKKKKCSFKFEIKNNKTAKEDVPSQTKPTVDQVIHRAAKYQSTRVLPQQKFQSLLLLLLGSSSILLVLVARIVSEMELQPLITL